MGMMIRIISHPPKQKAAPTAMASSPTTMSSTPVPSGLITGSRDARRPAEDGTASCHGEVHG